VARALLFITSMIRISKAVFFQSALVVLALHSALAIAGGPKPPLMPPRISDEMLYTNGGSGGTDLSSRLGIQGGAVAFGTSMGTPLTFGDILVGGRLFSRFSLGGRFYLIPSLGYYQNIASSPATAPHLAEAQLGLQFALFKLGPVGFLIGATQRLDFRFFTNGGFRGTFLYRAGPGATINIRLHEGLSIVTGADMTVGFSGTMIPEWTAHTGLLIGL